MIGTVAGHGAVGPSLVQAAVAVAPAPVTVTVPGLGIAALHSDTAVGSATQTVALLSMSTNQTFGLRAGPACILRTAPIRARRSDRWPTSEAKVDCVLAAALVEATGLKLPGPLSVRVPRPSRSTT